MPAVAMPPASSHVFQIGDYRVEVEHARGTRLCGFLKSADPDTSLWCFRCERAFRLGDARVNGESVHCGYLECAGEPLDFWSWAAYRAFVGGAPEAPEPARRYPLAA